VRNIFHNKQFSAGDHNHVRHAGTVLLYIGRITSGRGLPEAIKALQHLPNEYRLRIVGYGPAAFTESLIALADGLGVSSRVEFREAVPPEGVVREAAGADIALVAIEPVCLSYRFALPNKLFEAIQARLPIVGSDLPDIGDVVRGFDIGALYTPGDPRALARAVRAVKFDESRFRDNVDTAARVLHWTHEEEALQSVYQVFHLGRNRVVA
jgi:glycosyltransferase involved in cell wall biosynthesis